MRTSLRRDLTAALKTRDRVAAAALRSALAAIDNAEALPESTVTASSNGHVAGAATGVGAAEAERRHLTDVDLRTILEREVHEREVSAQEFDQLGRHDPAERLRAEAAVLGRYLRPDS